MVGNVATFTFMLGSGVVTSLLIATRVILNYMSGLLSILLFGLHRLLKIDT